MDWTPFFVSLHLALWVTGILVLVGLPLGWVFARSSSKLLLLVESFFHLPLVLAPTVVGFYLLIALTPMNPLGQWLEATFSLRLVFTFEGLVVACSLSGLPFMLSGLKPALSSFPSSQLEASATLGKGRVETFFRIVLPQIKTGVLTGVVTTFTHTLGEFGVVLLVGGSLPGITKVVSIAIFERVEALDFSGANAYALTLVMLCYPAVVWLNYLQRRPRRQR